VSLAALDLGTNSTRVLIARAAPDRPGGYETLDRRMRITRMGAGVDAHRKLAPDAVDRVLVALREYRAAMDEHGVTAVRAVATSAARDASNREELFDAVEAVVGARPELLSGDDEARLSFDGATCDLDAPGPYLVVDIGGGSTEFVLGHTAPEGVISVDVGCVRVTEQFLVSDPPRPEELSQALDVVRLHLDDVVAAIPAVRTARTVVGLAGTVSTAAAMDLGLHGYDRDRIHHFHLTRDAAEEIFRTVATEAVEDRRHNPGLEPGRVEVIVGGMLVLVAVMRYFDLSELLVSESDILDGLVRSLL
jgi:exopolyphosphatase/guanosine-5'-triphosphate,3'-diphosphate pyrophosphatase